MPVYIYTDTAADVTDVTVKGTILHRLHNAAVMQEELTIPRGVLTTNQNFTMFIEGSAHNTEGVVRTLVDTGLTANFGRLQLLARLD